MFSCCCTDETEAEIKVPEVTREGVLLDEKQTTEAASGKATPAPAKEPIISQIFEVDLDIGNEETCGIKADFTCDAFPIIREITGAAATWNNSCTAGQEIKAYDQILKVDDEAATSDNVTEKLETKDKRKLKLTLKRPVQTEVVLRKPGQLGITINYKNSSMSIWIAALHEGLAAVWNTNNPDKAIAEHDRIIEVNGTKGQPRACVDQMRDGSDTMVLTILRYS